MTSTTSMPRHDTERLVLEPLNADDATVDFLFGMNSDPEVMRYLTGGKPNSRAEVIMAARAAVMHRSTTEACGGFSRW